MKKLMFIFGLRPEVVKMVPVIFEFLQGDITTTFAGALTVCYEKIPVAHLEAGLRTYDKYSPFRKK